MPQDESPFFLPSHSPITFSFFNLSKGKAYHVYALILFYLFLIRQFKRLALALWIFFFFLSALIFFKTDIRKR